MSQVINDKMTCEGCQADLKKANHLPLEMSNGVLIIVCPLCKYESLGRVDYGGHIFLINNQDPSLSLNKTNEKG